MWSVTADSSRLGAAFLLTYFTQATPISRIAEPLNTRINDRSSHTSTAGHLPLLRQFPLDVLLLVIGPTNSFHYRASYLRGICRSRVSVCPSQVRVLLKWLNYSFLMPKIFSKFERGQPQRGANACGVGCSWRISTNNSPYLTR